MGSLFLAYKFVKYFASFEIEYLLKYFTAYRILMGKKNPDLYKSGFFNLFKEETIILLFLVLQ